MRIKTVAIHLGLFLITFFVTTMSGVEWTKGYAIFITKSEIFWSWDSLKLGLVYSCCFIGILTIHEFGHYLFARYYKAEVTLPYYIPMWFGFLAPVIGGMIPSIGTMGAFIKIKSPLHTRSQFFDVGVAGPLAGFIAAFFVLVYGFTHLPEPEYIYQIHPGYQEVFEKHGMGSEKVYEYEFQKEEYIKAALANDSTLTVDSIIVPSKEDFASGSFGVGNNLLMTLLGKWLVDNPQKIPHRFEMMHYPVLFAGYLACFFTALNLIPIGQLDGGHVMYGLLGHQNFNKISPYLFLGFVFYGGLGIITPAVFEYGFTNWDFVYVMLLFFMFSRIYPGYKERIFYVFVIVALQFITVFVFPKATGYSGYLVFALVVGRFLGIHHPPSLVEREMNLTRKVVGIIAIIVFILCFSPVPFTE